MITDDSASDIHVSARIGGRGARLGAGLKQMTHFLFPNRLGGPQRGWIGLGLSFRGVMEHSSLKGY
jgi:hypothetical protein